jgi:hypothetical protein
MLSLFGAAGPTAAMAARGLTFDRPVSTTDGKGEPEVAVNPRDPTNLVAALMSGALVS